MAGLLQPVTQRVWNIAGLSFLLQFCINRLYFCLADRLEVEDGELFPKTKTQKTPYDVVWKPEKVLVLQV